MYLKLKVGHGRLDSPTKHNRRTLIQACTLEEGILLAFSKYFQLHRGFDGIEYLRAILFRSRRPRHTP